MLSNDIIYCQRLNNVDSLLFISSTMKGFFGFLEEKGLALPIKANYKHLEAYKERLSQKGLDSNSISETLVTIKNFYTNNLNKPL